MPDWLAPVFGLLGVILGVSVSEFRHWRESKERYRVMTFEKRLKVHQEALSWFYRLQRSLNYYDAFVEKKRDDIDKTLGEVQEWWQNNCLLLDEASRQKMLDSMIAILDHVGFDESYNPEVYASLREMRDTIIRGIGIRHLPELPK